MQVNILTNKPVVNLQKTGKEMYALMTELFPICRSLTGNGFRDTLKILKKQIPLQIHEVPSGTKVLDWSIPKEWNIHDAWIKDPYGKKVVDFKESNLHVVSYSIPVAKKISLVDLKKHIHTLEEYPDWIPYLTSYYHEDWGFCMTHNALAALKPGTYEIKINSTLEDGSLTYGEYYLKGETEEEVLLTTYPCHPSLCNDNLSGVVLLTQLAKYLTGKKLKYSYRFLFIPETIGALTWLSKNEENLSRIKFGLVVTCVGDPGNSTYKKSRDGSNTIDKIAEKVLQDSGEPFRVLDFWPAGSDERQFCSPGFNLPIGSLMRSVYAQYPEYHTSADNLEFVKAEYLANSLKKYLDIVYIIENNTKYMNLNPKGEPQLGRRGLYQKIGGRKDALVQKVAIFWILNLSDGKNSLLDIAIRSGLAFSVIREAADALENSGLLEKCDLREQEKI